MRGASRVTSTAVTRKPPRLPSVALSKLGVAHRVVFALAFFGAETYGIVKAQHLPDRVFGFQMFNESSQVTVHLFREIEHKKRRILEPLPDGRWRARDARGVEHEHAWSERVRSSKLSELGRTVHARYGLDAQLFRLQGALEDVVRHLPDDNETRALVAEVETLKNGEPGPRLRLRADKP
jgi:hypothetical protein